MSSDRAQRIILRICAVAGLAAAPGVIAPRLIVEKLSWLMNLQEPPMTPLLHYMMAGGSAVYLAQSLLMGMISFDVPRYRPLIRFLGLAFLIFGAVFWWIDSEATLPLWWRIIDAGGCLLAGGALLWSGRMKD